MRFSTRCFIILVSCGLGIILSSMAYAQTSRIYFAGYMGLTTFDNIGFTDSVTPATGTVEPDNAINFAGALGVRFSRNFRMEAEVSYRDAKFESANIAGTGITPVDGDITSTMFLLSGYYDFDIKGWKTQPYLSAGLGMARHAGELTDPGAFTANVEDETFGFVWTAGAGIKYRVRPNFAWTAGYRYLDGTEIDFNNTSLDLSSHEIRLGLEWDLDY